MVANLADNLRALFLVFIGLFLLADGVLAYVRPGMMWSYASHEDYLLRGLLGLLWVGFGLHLLYEWR